MDHNMDTAAFNRQTVLNFRLYDPSGLQRLAADLPLSMSPYTLLFCRDHFRMQEGRDPLVGELRFLDALVALREHSPITASIGTVTATEAEDIRVLTDLQKKRTTLQQQGFDIGDRLTDWADTAGMYLSRCGVPPYHDSFALLPALHAAQMPQDTAFVWDGLQATVEKKRRTPAPHAHILVLLSPGGTAPFEEEVARFFAAYTQKGVCPIGIVGGEGWMPHLLSLGGCDMDISLLPACANGCDATALLEKQPPTVLFSAPNTLLPELAASGAHITPFGVITGNQRLLLRQGEQILLSLSHRLPEALLQPRTLTLTLPPRREHCHASTVLTGENRLFGGARVEGGCERALLALIGQLAQSGADLSHSTLSTLWELPADHGDAAQSAKAFAPLIDLHRICTELSLPTTPARQVLCAERTEPTLSIGILVQKGKTPPEAFTERWQNAADKRDFSALRTLLYQN